MDWHRPDLITPDKPPPLNGFDVSICAIDPKKIQHGGPIKNAIPALSRPKFTQGDEHDRFIQDDLILVGVEIDGEARAYPLTVLESHEAINDEVNGTPILVTYHPLCRTVTVYDRRVEKTEITFGVSGLLYQSNALIFDRQEDGQGESLWCQLTGEAVTGPASTKNAKLRRLPCTVTTWKHWQKTHPNSLAMSSSTGYRFNYNPAFSRFKAYYQSPQLIFPFDAKLDRPAHLTDKDLLFVVAKGDRYLGFAFRDLEQKAREGLTVDCFGKNLNLTYVPEGPSIFAKYEDHSQPVSIISYWFALSALLGARLLFADLGTNHE